MKEVFNRIFCICCVLLLLNACKTEQEVSNDKLVSNQEVYFGASISKARTTGNLWDKGDAIGVYAVNNQGQIPHGIFDNKANIKYINSDGNDKFTAASTKIYFPETGSIDFIAYYPYQKEMSEDTYSIDISNQDKLGNIDLLYSDNAKNISNKSKEVDLEFEHMLSMVTIDIVTGENISSLEGLEIEVNNTTTKGAFNLSNKGISLTEESQNKVIPKVVINTENKSNAKANMILIPGQDMGNTTIVFKVGNNSMECKLDENLLLSGRHYTYKVKLSYTNATEIVSSTIKDWIVENQEREIDVIIKPDDSEQEEDNNNGEGENNNTDEELLFVGSDFNITEDYENSRIRNGKLTIDNLLSSVPNIGLNNTQAIKISGKVSRGANLLYILLFKVGKEKLDMPYTQITFYIKGETKSGITVCLADINDGQTNSRVFFNIDNTTINDIIMPSLDKKFETGYEDGINTKGKWKKVRLDITELPEIYRDPRNAFGIHIEGNIDYEFLIDEIRVK